jgi:molecular chaperone DnaK
VRNGEYGLGIDVGGGAVSAAVCRPDGGAVPLPLGEGPVAPAVGDDGRIALVPADGTAGRASLVARVGDPVPVYAGGRAVPAAELVADVVQSVRRLAAEQEGRPDAWTVVTVPPSWAGHRCATLAAALTAAGVPRFSLVSSAVAAVAAHVAAGDLAPEPTVAVYDLGAGSLDTAVVGPDPDRPLAHLAVPPAPLPWGGRDVDDVVLAHVLDCLGAPPGDARALRRACRAAKEALSTATVVRIATDGPDGPIRLTREELDEVLAGPVRESAEALAATVAAAGLDPADLDAVVLAGGSVRVPLVAEVLSAELGRPLVVGGDPALTPALGAAALAAEALAAEAQPAAAPAAALPTELPDPPSDVVDPQRVLAPPRTPRGRHRPGSPPRAATGPAARRGARLRRGAVVAGLALGLLSLGPAAAGLFDAVLSPGPAGQSAAGSDDGPVIASGTATVGGGSTARAAERAVGGSTARAAESAGDGALQTTAGPTGSPRISLAAAIATAARTSTPSTSSSAAPTRDRTAPGTTPSAPSPSRTTAGETPSGTASPSAPSTGTTARPSPSGPAPVVEESTGSGQSTTPQSPVPQPSTPTQQPPVSQPPVSRPPVPDPFRPDPPTQQPPASPSPADETTQPEPEPEPTDSPATDAPATEPAPSTEGAA